MTATLSSAHFNEHINDLFQLITKGTIAANVRLVAVDEFPKAAHNKATRVPFSLLFCAADNMAVTDSSFTLHHPKLGQLTDIYFNRILPPDPRDTRPHYQAVFN